MPVDYEVARGLLENSFAQAEEAFLSQDKPDIDDEVRDSCNALFRSSTQSYREAVLDCTLVRILDKSINIRLPKASQGPNAISLRNFNQKVVNPFLHEKRIPCSGNPYLAVFRRAAQFDQAGRSGVRDKEGYDHFLFLIDYLESLYDDSNLETFLIYLLLGFVELREAASVALFRLQRMSLEQYEQLMVGLLATPSGGRFPVLLVVAALTAVKDLFSLDWEISWQGINVADRASGASGDITVLSGGRTLFAAEVTERPIDQSRVIVTFNTKIAPAGLEDYLFLVKTLPISEEAAQQARQYFTQGHEINFLAIKDWILMLLATTGTRGRAVFNSVFLELLGDPDVPAVLRVSWNEQLSKIAAGQRS